MRILRFKQHNPDGTPTDDFFQEHLARATASRAAAILDFTQKGVEGSTRRLYRLEKVAEILSGVAVADHYVSAPMRAGTAAEPITRVAYSEEECVLVEQVGFIVADDERFGFSPDGLVGNAGAIEAKGPKTTTHLRWMDEGVIPEEHLPQLWFDFMVCPPLEWIDFISRDGGMSTDPAKFGAILPRRYVQFSIRLERRDCLDQIAKMKAAAEKFMDDVQATVDRISAKVPELPQEPAPDPELGGLGVSDEELSRYLNLGRAGA
jgi:hypothetical protein